MKLITWNVNGLRAALKKGFADFVKKRSPDALCVQETKSRGEPIALEIPGYEQYWNHAEKKGYSGTLTLVKKKPPAVSYGIGMEKHDKEGRVLTAEFADFYLVNVYVPNSKRELSRLPYREKEWDVDFLKYLKKLEKKKSVIACGDFNVAHKEIDLANPKANVNNHGFTPQERRGFDNLLAAGFIDTFRHFNQEAGRYTWWTPMGNCRARNIGWRIDYFIASQTLKSRLKACTILADVMGSDHCPVELDLK